jgi:hypothetical protein
MRAIPLTSRITLLVAWYDIWIGLFIDRAKRRAYLFPLPCVGLIYNWGPL